MKQKWLILISSLSLCVSCANKLQKDGQGNDWSSSYSGKADIYGEDSRKELNDPLVGDAIRELGQSVAMVFSMRELNDIRDGKVIFRWQTMSQRVQAEKGVPLCEEEAFAEQPAPGYCTAFLIAPDLVATAGHCVNKHTRCEQMGFAFGYAKKTPHEDPITIPEADFYRCEMLIGRLYNPLEEQETTENKELWQDWAVMKLNRPVTNREPVRLMSGEFLKRGTEIKAIGHPSGISMKVTDGVVISDDKERYMNTTLDIYKGNSGSPTFDVVNGDVHGIVIRGTGGNSFRVTEQNCAVSKTCDEVGPGCYGNHVLRIDPVRVFTKENLEIIEQHSLVEDDQELGFRYSFSFEEESEVAFATLHLNAFAREPKKLRAILHHGDLSIELMNHPINLPYGRWTVTSEAFAGQKAQGEWIIEVIDEGGSDIRVEWAQVMLGVLP